MKKLMLAWMVGVVFSVSALTVWGVTSAQDSVPVNHGEGQDDYKPDQKPDQKPDGTGEGGETGGGGTGGGGTGGGGTGGGGTGGGSSEAPSLSGVLEVNCITNFVDGTLTSTTSNQNVILVKRGGALTLSGYTLNKSGDTSSEDNSNFYAVNAVVAVQTNCAAYIDNTTVNSNAKGANCLFATGAGSTIYAYDCTITSTKGSSRGLDATYAGTVIASKLKITTSGEHCAAFATDRGNGSISVTKATMTTAGQGSPLIYSTGAIEVNSVTGTATGAQIAGIEGLSTIRIKNSVLSGSEKQASEPVANGVIIYQSNSGDYTTGTATFEVSDSTLTSAITNGAMFYITHSEAVITVQNTDLAFDTNKCYLIKAAGNDGTNGWGTKGSNGAGVVFTAIDQTLSGDISVDGISSNDLYLVNSTYTGTIVKDTTYTGNGEANVFVDADSTWTVTADCTLKNLTAANGATIVDGSGKIVSIVGTDTTKYVTGASALTITVSNYTEGDFTATNITAFAIDRTAFDAKYGTAESEEEEGGGSSDTGSKTYYFKPHAPTNGVVGVSYNGTKIYPDMDHKYWLDAYWTNGVTVTVDFSSDTTSGYFFADGSSVTSQVLTITENRIDVYPPAGFETAYKAQAKSGASYYLTLKKAIEAAKNRARIVLNDNVTLDETLTVTNSITLDLDGTNVLTLGSALTNAFHFTAGGTISNGTINSSLAANVEGSVLMRFTDCKATLKNLTINGCGYETLVAHDSTKDLAKKYTKDASDALLCDGLILTGNGCLLSVDYANATLTNGCSFTVDDAFASFGGTSAAAISCTGNGTVTIADGTYASPKVLQVGDFGGAICVNGGTFSGQIYSWMSASAHTNLTAYESYKAQFVLTAGTYTDASLAFAYADSFDLSSFTKGDGVAIEVPTGYAWVDHVLVRESISAGVTSDAYSDALSATNAADTINANKASCIAVPTNLVSSATDTYLAKVEATVTSDNRVVLDLTAEAKIDELALVTAAVTSETAVVSLISTNIEATVTISPTTPGLYYWIVGGTDVGAITNVGEGVLSTDGGSLELAKPTTLDATQGKAFFKLAAGLLAPTQTTED